MTDCVFCKIVKGDIPCTKIDETPKALAFLDIAPISKGHTLIIPKEHYENIIDTPHAVLAEVMPLLKKVTHALASYAEGVTIGQNNGRAAGQVVNHIHFHVIPRFAQDGLINWPHGTYTKGEEAQVAQAIKKLLQ